MEATGSGRWERRPLANHDASIKSNMSPFQTVTVINASETHVLSPPLGPLFLLISLPLTNIYSVCLFLSPAAGEHTHGAALWNNCCLFFKRPSPCCLFSSCLCSLLIFFFFFCGGGGRLGGITSHPGWSCFCLNVSDKLTSVTMKLVIDWKKKETPVQFKSPREASIQILLSQIPSSPPEEGKQHVHCALNAHDTMRLDCIIFYRCCRYCVHPPLPAL